MNIPWLGARLVTLEKKLAATPMRVLEYREDFCAPVPLWTFSDRAELMRTTVNFLSVEPDTNLSPDSLYQVRFIDKDADSDLIFSNFLFLIIGIQ